MSGRVTSCCVALLLTLTTVSSVQRLNSIHELLQNDQSLHEQILPLLQWFATTADINDNGIRLTFDPEGGDYGSHYYGNSERLLEQPLDRQRYYTLGNIYQKCSVKLPPNVVKSIQMNENSVRIIMSISRSNQGWQAHRIDRVYITRHYDDTCYDPEHTYEISTQFLREMRDNLSSQLRVREQSARRTPHSQSYNYRDHHQENQWSAMNALMIVFGFILLLCILLFYIVYFLPNSEQPKSRWL